MIFIAISLLGRYMPADALFAQRSPKHGVCESVILEDLWPAEHSVTKLTVLLRVF